MDKKHRELLELHRDRFNNTIDVEKLFPILQDSDVLDMADVNEIASLSNRPSKVNRLLDIIPSKGNLAFQTMCLALETTYPHLLTLMFLGSKNRAVTDSRPTSLTSDSEDDVLGPPPRPDSQLSETYTRIIPPNEYDYDPDDNNVGGYQTCSNYPIENQNGLSISFETQLDHKNSHGHHRDYDWLKSQCEHAMSELQSLKQQQSDIMKRCDQAMKETDVYRRSYKMTLSQLQQAKDEIELLKSNNNHLISENETLEKDVESLQHLRDEDKVEISELRQQQREVINESGSNEVLNKMCDSALDKYEAAKRDFDDLRDRFAELMTAHGSCKNKLESSSEEVVRLRKQLENTCMERDSAIVERNGLKQQCTAAIRNWDQVLREKDEVKGALEKVTQQRDKYMKSMNQELANHLRAQKDRDSVLKEYTQIMSERDVVHKEIEHLQDKLNETMKNLEQIKKEKSSALDHSEVLRREIKTSLEERDKAVKERNDMYDKYSALVTKGDHIGVTTSPHYHSLTDRHLGKIYESDKVDKHELDNVTKETEALRKQIEELKQELSDAVQEAEIAKKQRDWAFKERDKIVQERDSIRTLGDKLRRERDRAVSNLAQSLRDFDEMKRENIESAKELKDVRDKYDALVEKEARKNQLNSVGHNNSRDSAIDADMQEWETEIIDVELTDIDVTNLGFELIGGKDEPQFPNDSSIFVSQIVKGSQASSKLRLNDMVLKINNLDVTNIDRRAALQAVRSKKGILHMLLRRRKAQTPRSWQPIHLSLSSSRDHGLQIECGLFINAINPNSAIGKDGTLTVGDRITMVNNHSVEGMSVKQLTKMLSDSGDCLIIDVWRQMSPVNSPGSSPTPIIHSVMPHLSEQSLVPSPVIPTEKVDMRRQLWTPDTSEDSKNSTKNLKTSGSQTDSLDSPGSTPKYSRNNRSAKEMVKIFPSKHKSHDSTENNKNQQVRNSMVPDTQTLDEMMNKSMQRAGQKRELESENSGTWPKCVRVNHTPNGTVIAHSPDWRKRPSIDAVINGHYDLVSSRGSGPSLKHAPVSPHRPSETFQHKGPETFNHVHSSPVPTKSSKSNPYLSNQFRPNAPNYTTRIVSPSQPNSYERPGSRQKDRHWSSHPISQQNFHTDLQNRPVSLEVKKTNMLSVSHSNDIGETPLRQPFQVSSSSRPSKRPQTTHTSSSQSKPYTQPYVSVYDNKMWLPSSRPPYHSSSDWHSSPSPHPSIPSLEGVFSPSDQSISNESDTIPRKAHERKFPSTPSGPTSKSGSYEIVSHRSSPISPMFQDYSYIIPHSISPAPTDRPRRKPMRGETRKITIERTSEPVGFQIGSISLGGIFVSSVTENSLAFNAGLAIGDQLLEVCGINMRCATYDHAALVLKNCGSNLTMKVQYNPEKYTDIEDSGSSSGNISSTNSPDSPCKQRHLVSPNAIATLSPSSPHRMSIVSENPQESPRYITFKKNNPHTSLGVTIVGGNAVGILVHEVQPDSIAFGHSGLHCGDQILEYNGISFKNATAEEAVNELSKPCSTVRIQAQYNPTKYSKVRFQPGDSFYVRSHFDRAAKHDGEMGFRKDSIIHVENTIHNGKIGLWYASIIDEDGNKLKSGTILSKDRLEEDMMLRRSLSESRSLHDSDELKGSTRRPGPRSARGSFFRRKRHQRNNSKDSQDLGGSFSDASLNSDSVPVLDDFSVSTYTRVERIEYNKTRPVILLAPLVEPLLNKLASESPDKYSICSAVAMHTSLPVMEQGLSDGTYIEYWTNDNHFMCIRTKDVTEICNKRIHCLLNVTPATVERLQRLKIYPIVIFARHKSYRQIREQKDVKFLPDKMGHKSCRDLFEHYQKVEQDFHHLFSAIIQGGNLAEMCMQIKTVIDSEQKKPIWVPASSL